MSAPLILDFDGSVLPLPGVRAIPLGQWQEAIRFGCRMRTLRALDAELGGVLDARSSPVFMGSGDYHHVTLLLIERLRALGRPVQVVVLDNHPDNMRYPFGIHCGSWISHVSRLPFVTRVHVAGITSPDVESAHAWENRLGPLRSGKVSYWCVQRNLRALHLLGARHARSFASIPELLAELSAAVTSSPEPVYLSIDKDVLAPEVVQTNWDQGVMRLEELRDAIAKLRGRLIGSDVTGDVSSYRYRGLFKRLLSGLDRQPQIPEDVWSGGLQPAGPENAGPCDGELKPAAPPSLGEWQARHQQINAELLSLLPP